MATLNEFPKIMRDAREDLGATVSGRFSPHDWDRILGLARQKWTEALGDSQPSPEDELRAWQAVILDFHRHSYWGFSPNHKNSKPPVTEVKSNLGLHFIFMVFFTFTLTIIAVVWLGQIYTSSDDPADAYKFFAVLVLVLANFAFLLWKTRHHKD